jgi:hypothetical protein
MPAAPVGAGETEPRLIVPSAVGRVNTSDGGMGCGRRVP